MTDQEIIGLMVKGRECCRRVLLAYEKVWDSGGSSSDGSVESLKLLAGADLAAAQMLMHLDHLPEKPSEHIANDDQKVYADRVMGEIGMLLEKTMVLEREVRNVVYGGGRVSVASNRPRAGAMKAYAMV